MAKARSYSKVKSSSKNLVVVAVSAVSLIAVTALVVGIQSFGWLNPHASALTPHVTRRVVDNFRDTKGIDPNFWTVAKHNDDVTLKGKIKVTETALENLRIELPTSPVNSDAPAPKSSYVSLTKNGSIEALGDFMYIVQMYRPVVSGQGKGRVGIQFASNVTGDDEVAGVYWAVDQGIKEGATNGQLVFYVNNSKGQRLITTPVSGNFVHGKVTVRLDRKDNSYVAYYKANSFDLSGDTPWQTLGRCVDAVTPVTRKPCNEGLGKAGVVSLYAYNGDVEAKYPSVVSTVDTAILRWEDSTYTPPVAKGFVDNFNNNVVEKSWKYKVQNGATLSETSDKNLVITIPDTNEKKAAARVDITRTLPIIGVEKDFAYNVVAFKPEVTGEGAGLLNLSFVSATGANKEQASLKWIVINDPKTVAGKKALGTSSQLVFNVINGSGDGVGTTQTVSLPSVDANASILMLRLARTTTNEGNTTTYRAWYHVGTSGDTDWKPVGKATEEKLGEDGSFVISASNTGAKINNVAQFPKVVVRVDAASGTIAE